MEEPVDRGIPAFLANTAFQPRRRVAPRPQHHAQPVPGAGKARQGYRVIQESRVRQAEMAEAVMEGCGDPKDRQDPREPRADQAPMGRA